MSRRPSLFDNSLLFTPPVTDDNNVQPSSRSSFLSTRLSSISSEFATLFRSHTISAQKLSAYEVLQSAYADTNTTLGHDTNTSQRHSISSPPPMSDERTSRKQKSENRFYNFLTRSRSRSRSKHDHESPPFQPANPSSSSKSRSSPHQKVSSAIPHHSLPSPPQSPGSKPVSRIQSRPLSSTTTATNTTITPATPKARRHQQALPGSPTSVRASRPATAPAVTAPVTARQASNSNSTASSHQSQPPAKGTRRKLHELFSLPLRRKSTSRSRSRSRPTTPVLLSPGEAPPLPIPVSAGQSLGFDDHVHDPTPRPGSKASLSYPDLDYVEMRTSSPTPGPRILKVMNPSTPTATPGSTTIKLPRLFSGSAKPTPSKQSSGDSALTSPPTPSSHSHPLPPLPTSTISTSIVSHPIKRVPSQSHYRRSTASTATEGTYATPQNSSVIVNKYGMASSSSLGHSNLPPPTIIHTPPTPLKPGENTAAQPPPLPIKPAYGGPSSRFHHAMKGSLDSGYRYRINTSMGVVDEEGRASPARSASVKVKGEVRASGKEREVIMATPVPSTIPRVATTKMSSAARATKHGSFDFERPGTWGAALGIQRTGSNGTTGSAASGHHHPYEAKKERESTYGAGMAGVGTLQRDVSMRRVKDREEEAARKKEEEARKKEKEKERARKRPSSNERREKERRPLTANSSQRTTPTGSDQAHGSTSTNGKGSSWGKAAGKKSKTASGGSRITMTAHHPLFDFEPPVPSPTRSTGSASGHGQVNVYSNGYSAYGSVYYEKAAEKEQQRLRDEKERYGGGKKNGGDKHKSAVPVPSLPSPIATIPSGTTSSGGMPVTSVAAIGSLKHHTTTLIQNSLVQKPLPSISTHQQPPMSTHQPPMYSASGHRAGTKGRSLDLGLGLAWAPTKVRADALLPSSTFFARSLSQGGSRRGRSGVLGGGAGGGGGGGALGSVQMSRSASGESGTSRSNGHGRGEGGGWDLTGVERSKLGREVAELFRSALDDEGYALFKNYVHRFDAHEIPFDGANGIVTLVQRLLVNAPHLEEEGRTRLLDRFIRIILQQA